MARDRPFPRHSVKHALDQILPSTAGCGGGPAACGRTPRRPRRRHVRSELEDARRERSSRRESRPARGVGRDSGQVKRRLVRVGSRASSIGAGYDRRTVNVVDDIGDRYDLGREVGVRERNFCERGRASPLASDIAGGRQRGARGSPASPTDQSRSTAGAGAPGRVAIGRRWLTLRFTFNSSVPANAAFDSRASS